MAGVKKRPASGMPSNQRLAERLGLGNMGVWEIPFHADRATFFYLCGSVPILCILAQYSELSNALE